MTSLPAVVTKNVIFLDSQEAKGCTVQNKEI